MGFRIRVPSINVKTLLNPVSAVKAAVDVTKAITQNTLAVTKEVNERSLSFAKLSTNPKKLTNKTVSYIAQHKIIGAGIGMVASYFGLGSLNKPANAYLDRVAAKEERQKDQAEMFPNVPVDAYSPEAVAAGVAPANVRVASAGNRRKSMLELLFGGFFR